MESQRSSDSARLTIFLAVLVLAALLIAWFGYLCMRIPERAVEKAIQKREETADLGTVVTRIRAMNRLETASMRIMNVSKTSQSYGVLPNSIAGDELTFLAVGDVIAGVDLSRLTRDDIRREADGTLVLRLPPPEILVTRVDNQQSHVIDRNTGVFRRTDRGLESRARVHAEMAIRNEALRQGILQLAQKNGETKLADFLHLVGFNRIRFESKTMTPRPL